MLPGVESGDVERGPPDPRRVAPPARAAADAAARPGRSAQARRTGSRKVTRRLGSVRELDVLLLADRRAARIRPFPRAGPAHCPRRGPSRSRERSAALKISGKSAAASLERLVRRSSTALARKLEEAEDAQARPRLAMGARRTRRRRALALSHAIDEAGAVYLPERLHAVRIALKKLATRSSCDVEARGPEEHRRSCATLKRIQELLGRLHDLQVLVDRVRRVQASLTPPDVDDLARARRAVDVARTQLPAPARALRRRTPARFWHLRSPRRRATAAARRHGEERPASADARGRLDGRPATSCT